MRKPACWKPAMLILAVMIWIPAAHAGGRAEAVEEQEILHQLSAKAELIVELVNANCVVESWPERRIDLRIVHQYVEDRYEVEIAEGIGVLRMRERLLQRAARPPAVWHIRVPADTELTFSSVSGDFESRGDYERLEADSASGNIDVRGLEAVMLLDTASGAVRLKQCSGKLSVNTAAGDVRIEDFHGSIRVRTASADVRLQNLEAEVEAVTASGKIDVSGLIPTGEGIFRSASGDVMVVLADSPRYDLTLTSSSGNIQLDLDGHEITGTLEFTALQGSGEIDSPLQFEVVEGFAHAGSLYIRKIHRVGSAVPKLTLATASGVARLKP